MDSNKIIKISLGSFHLEGNAKTLGDLSSIGAKIMEPYHFLLNDIKQLIMLTIFNKILWS